MWYSLFSSAWTFVLLQSWPLFFFFSFYSTENHPPSSQEYIVEYVSKLNLAGTTNINSFSCLNSATRTQSIVSVIPVGNCCNLKFDHPEIKIYIPTLDCGQKGINRDMQKALKADDFPYIRIQVRSAQIEKGKEWLNGGVSNFSVKTRITITDVCREVEIPMMAVCKGDNLYQFSGCTTLYLTDFGLEPPKVLMGLIEVNNQISVEFDISALAL